MKRIIKLLPIAAVICMGMLSCDKDDNDDKDAGKNSNMYLGHEYVDLGLKVKWATCNVGATTREGYGDYFAWGDTTTLYKSGYAQSDAASIVWKDDDYVDDGYSWLYYTHMVDGNKLTKYCNDGSIGSCGYTDSYNTLLSVDDVANYMWGGNWRMPTKEDFDELLNNCNWEKVTQRDVECWKVTSKKDSSKSIFLPAAGYRGDTNLSVVGSYGHYWSSSLDTDNPKKACCLDFSLSEYVMSSSVRYLGFSVRPVCP